MPNYWLMKSEPNAFSIDDLKQIHKSSWDGVRNYQARNFMKEMKEGDLIFFYHSSCSSVGIAGTAQVSKAAYPDHTSWDTNSAYFDPKSTAEAPRWYMVDIVFVEKWSEVFTLATMKLEPKLANMPLVKKGNRLSIMPIDEDEWQWINENAQY